MTTQGQEDPFARFSDADIIAAYVTCRDKVEELEQQTALAIATASAKMVKLSIVLEGRMLASEQSSVKTSAGTAILATRSTPVCHDWAAFEAYAIAEKRTDFFPRKLNVAPLKEMLETTGELPPGVRFDTSRTLSVRRPTGSKTVTPESN